MNGTKTCVLGNRATYDRGDRSKEEVCFVFLKQVEIREGGKWNIEEKRQNG